MPLCVEKAKTVVLVGMQLVFLPLGGSRYLLYLDN